LHHDVAKIVAGADVRLRLMQFSLYARGDESERVRAEAPVLIGRERERMIATTDPPPRLS
jgi:hypothetical protein